MFASVYSEYVEHSSIPGGRAYVSMPGGKSMSLRSVDGDWVQSFRNRAACVKWLKRELPDALLYAFDDGITLCAGSVANM